MKILVVLVIFVAISGSFGFSKEEEDEIFNKYLVIFIKFSINFCYLIKVIPYRFNINPVWVDQLTLQLQRKRSSKTTRK